MNGISFHTARGQRIINVEFSRAVTQDELDKQNEASAEARRAAEGDDADVEFTAPPESDNGINFGGSGRTAPVTDTHPTTATDPSDTAARVRFTLFGGEVVTVDADKLAFNGAAKGRAVDERTGLPTIQIGNDGALNNPASHRVDQAALQSDWLVQWYDWRNDETNYAVIDSATLHTITRRGLN